MRKKPTPAPLTTIKYGNLDIQVLDQKSDRVPDNCVEVIFPEEDKHSLAIAVNFDIPTLLIGETGTAKTSAIREIAYLRKQGYVRINMHGYNTPDELIGSKSVKNSATYYEDGILTKAMKEGHVVVLDEINATPPDCTFILHGLLDEDKRISLPNGDIIRPHKDFRFFATMNPDYEGTKSMNRAFLDRFNIILNIEVLEPKKEAKLISDRTNIPFDLASQLVTFAHIARKAYSEQKTLTFVSTRSLLQWGNLISKGLDTRSAYDKSVLNKTSLEQRQAFVDYYSSVFKTNPSEIDPNQPFLTTIGVINNLNRQISDYKTEMISFEKRLNTERGANLILQKKLNDAEQMKKNDISKLETEYQKILEGITKDAFSKAKNQFIKDAEIVETVNKEEGDVIGAVEKFIKKETT